METPTFAFAEKAISSAWTRSGLRSSRADGKPCRNLGRRHLLIDQRCAPWDRPRGATDQDAELVLLGNDLGLESRNRGRGLCEGCLGALDLKLRGDPALELAREKIERLLKGVDGVAGDLKLRVELAKLEVGLCNPRDKRENHAAARGIGGQELTLRRLGGPADAAPNIDLPGDVERGQEEVLPCSTGRGSLVTPPKIVPLPREASNT